MTLFVSSATELTTAATDAALGLTCVVVSLVFLRLRVTSNWKRRLWLGVFSLFAVGSFLGAAAHGLDVTDSVQAILWEPLYLSIGLAVALFVVGALFDWRGAGAARAMLPWALAAGAGFFVSTHLLGGSFLIFVVYEASALVAAFGVYVLLSIRRRLTGAHLVATGIGLSLLAAIVQATDLSVRVIVPYDHNGLFHLIQLVAIVVLAIGLARSLAPQQGSACGSSDHKKRKGMKAGGQDGGKGRRKSARLQPDLL